MIKAHIVFDKNNLSKKIKNFLEKKIKNYSINKCNLIIVVGGDGFMLSTLKKYNKLKRSFYGINSGNYGFLMNKFSSKNTIKNLSKAKMVSISPLEMIVKNKSHIIKKSIAINEVSILRQSRQAASLEILNGSTHERATDLLARIRGMRYSSIFEISQGKKQVISERAKE